jgi:hypothetical protein
MTTYGSKSGQDMWICRIQVTAKPIIRYAAGRGMRPQLMVGDASRNPMKNTTEAGRT